MAFQISFTIFLVMSALTFIIVIKTKGILSLPLVLGLMTFILGSYRIIPGDLIPQSKMHYVGMMAYQVLIIHSGTKITWDLLKKYNKEILYFILNTLSLVIILKVISTQFGFMKGFNLVIGPMIGGGATAAITSFMSLKTMPSFSLLPWMVFMFHHLMALPIIIYFLKRNEGFTPMDLGDREKTTWDFNQKEIVPQKYKTTAYYLGVLMIISLVNQLMVRSFFTKVPLSPVVSALFLGVFFRNIRLLEKEPLNRSDAYGFLMLGLMSLMVNEILSTTTNEVIFLLKPLFMLMSLITVVFVITNFIFSKFFSFKFSYGGLILLIPMLPPKMIEPLILKVGKKNKLLIDMLLRINTFSLSFFSIILTSILNV